MKVHTVERLKRDRELLRKMLLGECKGALVEVRSKKELEEFKAMGLEGKVEVRNLVELIRKVQRGEDGREDRFELAKSKSTPPHILEKVYGREMLDVYPKAMYYYLASNPNTPQWILEKLSSADWYEVRGAVAANPNTPQWILKTLAKDRSVLVVERVASNSTTPTEVLKELLKHKSEKVREKARRNLEGRRD